MSGGPEINTFDRDEVTNAQMNVIQHILGFNRAKSERFNQEMDTFLLELAVDVSTAPRDRKIWEPEKRTQT